METGDQQAEFVASPLPDGSLRIVAIDDDSPIAPDQDIVVHSKSEDPLSQVHLHTTNVAHSYAHSSLSTLLSGALEMDIETCSIETSQSHSSRYKPLFSFNSPLSMQASTLSSPSTIMNVSDQDKKNQANKDEDTGAGSHLNSLPPLETIPDTTMMSMAFLAFQSWADTQREQFLKLLLPSMRLSQIQLLAMSLTPYLLPHLSPEIQSMMSSDVEASNGHLEHDLGASSSTLDIYRQIIDGHGSKSGKNVKSRMQKQGHTNKLLANTQKKKPQISSSPFTMRDVIDFIILNKSDILKWLPVELSLKILSYLDPFSLGRCGMVNKTWRKLSGDELLWKKLFLKSWGITETHVVQVQQQIDEVKEVVLARYKRKPTMDVDTVMTLAVGRVWKFAFRDRYRIRSNWERGNCSVRTFEGHNGGISCLQFNDNYIVSGSSDHTLKLWALKTNTHSILTLKGHFGTIRCLQFDSKKVVSGSNDKTLRVWDIEEGSRHYGLCVGILTGHSAPVRCLQVGKMPKYWCQEGISEENQVLLVSGAYDCAIKIWRITLHPHQSRSLESRTEHKCVRTLIGHRGPVICIQYDVKESNGTLESRLVSGSADFSIRLWDLVSGECLKVFDGHTDSVTCLQFDSYKIVSGSLDSSVKFWNIDTGMCEQTIDWVRSEGHRGIVRNLKFDQWLMISSGDDKTLKVWEFLNTSGNKVGSIGGLRRMLTLKRHTDGVTCLQFDYKMIVSGSFDKTIKLWDFSAP